MRVIARRLLWAIALLAAGICAAAANDTALEVRAGLWTVTTAHDSVRMAEAVITASVGARGTHVTCTYRFVNDGPDAVVSMGFPVLPGYGDIPEQQIAPPLRGFRTWVDGQEVATREARMPGSPSQAAQRWYVKEVRFAPGQERRVRNEYLQPHGQVSDGSAFFPYVLTTGASWRGPLGRLEVNLKWTESWDWVVYPQHTEETPWERSPDGRQYRWRAENLEPEHDVHFRFIPGWQSVDLDGFWVFTAGRLIRVEQGRCTVPARLLADLLRATLLYEPRTRTAIFVLGDGRRLELTAGQEQGRLAGRPFPLGRAPWLEEGGMWLPLEPVAGALGWQVDPHPATWTVHLRTGQPLVWLGRVQGPGLPLEPEEIHLARRGEVLLGEIRPLLKAVGEWIGGPVRLDDAGPESDWRLLRGMHDFRFSWGQTRAWREEQPYELPVAPYITATGTGMAPVEAFLAGLGLTCTYDEAARVLIVEDPAEG